MTPCVSLFERFDIQIEVASTEAILQYWKEIDLVSNGSGMTISLPV
jgi:hypothetical protein